MALHSQATGSELHEPKGAESASVSTTYISDGAGSGAWSFVEWDTISEKEVVVYAYVPDISTAGSNYVVSPYTGAITKIYTVISGPITGADTTISFEIAGTGVLDGGLVVAVSGSAAGVVDSSTPSSANVISAGQALEIVSDGASTGVVSANVTIVIEVS